MAGADSAEGEGPLLEPRLLLEVTEAALEAEVRPEASEAMDMLLSEPSWVVAPADSGWGLFCLKVSSDKTTKMERI